MQIEQRIKIVNSISVFCGSSPGKLPDYSKTAKELGRVIASENIRLVYGASNLGLMGIVAESVLNNGGTAIGVMPKIFKGKVNHPNLDELIIVDTMHQRKARMYELSDAFLALPGGLGTFEEILEMITWSQIGINSKPCGLLNISGYYDKLVTFLDYSVEQRFVKREHRDKIIIDDDIDRIFHDFKNYEALKVNKWLDRK